MAEAKKWGKNEYWGLSSLYDQDWVLTEEQKTLRSKLMEVCRTTIRPKAIHCDKTYEFPRKSLDALADLGLLGLIVPKEFGGLGESHVGAAMVVETLARYGCPSTALVYTMHTVAVASLLLRHHDNTKIQKLLSRLDKYKLVGAQSMSDPATGGHYWFPLSSKAKQIDENTLKIFKYNSWCTSSGHADWYIVPTLSPEFNGDYSNLSSFLIYKDEVRTPSENWSALGMHGTHSGPLVVEGEFSTDRLVGPMGDGQKSIDEAVDPFLLLLSSACWNGISMACMDVAKKHVTRKAHADVGMRVCDYPTIQDYFGECVASTSVSRSHVFLVAQGMDKASMNNDWSLYEDFEHMPRSQFVQWLCAAKFASAKNADEVSTKMLQACGGSGYKTELGLEHLFRDAKAACVMGPSNEVLRQILGNISLQGMDVLDFWEARCNDRFLHHELDKLSIDSKKALAQKILAEVAAVEESSGTKAPGLYETDFENHFNTSPPTYFDKVTTTSDGLTHSPSLNPSASVPLQLISRQDLTATVSTLVFSLANPTDHTGCLPGQYVQIKVSAKGKTHHQHFSPVSRPDSFGRIELIHNFKSQGIISKFLKELQPGETVNFTGPIGGFEYKPNHLDDLTILASSRGVAPAIQLVRCIVNNPSDKTRVKLIYHSVSYDEILFRSELDYYSDPRLKVIYTLSEVPEEWDGEEGYISTEIINEYVSKPNDTIKHKIVISGDPVMTTSCIHSLRFLNFPSDMIFVYGQVGLQQVRRAYGKNAKVSGHMCI